MLSQDNSLKLHIPMERSVAARRSHPLVTAANDRTEHLPSFPLNFVELMSNLVHAFISHRPFHKDEEIPIGKSCRTAAHTGPIENDLGVRLDVTHRTLDQLQQGITFHARYYSPSPRRPQALLRGVRQPNSGLPNHKDPGPRRKKLTLCQSVSKRSSPPTRVFSTLPLSFQP